ncbi:MAG: DoxX family membrane protein [Deltaproteobacteria bacterium]|nr:MAG: DoxX family membrane protein [Deltaproteobacteria bacterium]
MAGTSQSKWTVLNRWLCLAARLYLGGVFVYASVHKIGDPGGFALDVATYDILPLWAVNFAALALPWCEMVAGLCLIAGFRARAAALACAFMMVVFMAALASALARGLDMSCGCFASSSAAENDPISYLTMLRDSAWLLLAIYITASDNSPIGLDSLTVRRLKP